MAAITERPEELPLTVEISVESNLFHNFASLANLCGLAAITERPEELPLTVEISVFKPSAIITVASLANLIVWPP